MVFYYYSNRSIPVGLFRRRVQWRGDISRWDGSILLRDAQVNDSGTYVCEMRLLQRSSIFKNHTVLHVSPGAQRAAGAAAAAAAGSAALWSMVVGGCCVAVVLAFLAGLGLRRRRAAGCTAASASHSVPSVLLPPPKEGLYFSIPGAGVPKAEQDTGKKSRAEETYITMHPSFFRENGVYVELTRRVIPAEWMDGKRQEDAESSQPDCRAPGDPAVLQRGP
ncbi:JAML protein, partial [Nothoprocta pentlandii]|nr:JAML protein [Nothoprocta pentlandii]